MDFTIRILPMLSLYCILQFCFSNGFTTHLHRRFTKADICHETNSTLEFVSMCPNTEPLKLKQSKKKQCDSFPACNGEPLVYHCARYEERLVEVCAPRHFITGKCCALYDDGLGRVVEDYSRPCSECSFRYRSDDPLNYGKCLKTSLNNTSNEDTGTKCGKEVGRSKRDTKCNGEEEKGSGKMEQNDSSLSTLALAVVSVICLIVAIGMITFFIRRRSMINRPTQETTLENQADQDNPLLR